MIETSKRFLNASKFLVALKNKNMIRFLSNFGKIQMITYNNFTACCIFTTNGNFFGLLLALLLYIAIQYGVLS